ncbi:MAG: IS3 family transposase [Paludibacteraceae bacterium]|nr:IS3 family transposase [Paludibacteraceae bacterium]
MHVNNNISLIQCYNNECIKLKLKMSPVQYRTHFLNQVK